MPAVLVLLAAETLTVGMVAAAVAQIGIGLTVAGAVTGNKTMLKIGGTMALAGGITSIAANAGMFAGEAAAVGAEDAITTGMAADAATSGASAAAGSNAVALGGAELAGPMAESISTAALPEVAAGSLPAATMPAPAATEGLLTSQAAAPSVGTAQPGVTEGLLTKPTVDASLAGRSFGPMPLQPQRMAIATDATAGMNASGANVGPAGATTPGAGGAPTPGFSWKEFAAALKDSEIFKGSGGYAVMGAGQVISGYATGKAQQELLDAQQVEAARRRENMSAAGLLYPRATA